MISFTLISLLLGLDFLTFAIESPKIYIRQKTSNGIVKEVMPVDGNFTIEGNVEEIEFSCWSSYPNKWMLVPSPHRLGSIIKEFVIDKGRHVLENGDFKFYSNVIFRFTNNPQRALHQMAACHHFEQNEPNVLVYISSEAGGLQGNLIFNDSLKRSKTMGERYGRNKNCSLVMHLDSKKKVMTCINLEGIKTTPPYVLKCANPEECEACVQNVDSACGLKDGYLPIILNDKCTNCTSFGSKSGALICNYEGGGRLYSLAQIVFFTLEEKPFFYPGKIFSETTSRLRIEVLGESPLEHIYNGTTVRFQCLGVLWYFSEGIQWAIKHGNGTIQYLGEAGETTEERRTYRSTIDIKFPYVIGETRVICMGPVLNSYEWENVSLSVIVKESKPPTILTLTAVYLEGGELEVHCNATGNPLPVISWKKNSVILPPELWTSIKSKDTIQSVLHVTGVLGGGSNDEFTCDATNHFQQSAQSTVLVPVPKETGLNLGLTIGMPIVFLLLILLIIYLYWKIRVKNREIQKLTEDEIREFTHGNPQSGNFALFYPYNTDFEISKSKIHFESKILGDGQFGRVTRGKIGKGYVAIKTVKKFADISYLKALLSELKICCFVGKHENIVNLIGGCTQNIQNREVYLIYEYCANGNVLKYLRKYRDQFVNHLSNGKYAPSRASVVDYQNISVKKVSSKDLLRWAAEIASGMEFLGSKNIVHGDLAARNILLTESLKAKVGDFGLSKQLDDYSVYVQKLECPLPLKWMAIESLRDLEFSIKSDVWSYGITLWEIYSLGQPPYPGIPQWDSNSWKMLVEGYRMEKPQYATDQVFNVMLHCWELIPESRPTFSTIKNIFEELLIRLRGPTSLKIY